MNQADDQKPQEPIIWPWWKPMPTEAEQEQRARDFDRAVGTGQAEA